MWVKMKSRKSKKNKKITLALAAGVALTSFSTLSAKADEQVDLKPTDNTVAEEKHLQNLPTTSITQVEGVEVSNGTALVTKTPTEAVVKEAKEIKDQADQAVEAQTPVVEDAKKKKLQLLRQKALLNKLLNKLNKRKRLQLLKQSKEQKMRLTLLRKRHLIKQKKLNP